MITQKSLSVHSCMLFLLKALKRVNLCDSNMKGKYIWDESAAIARKQDGLVGDYYEQERCYNAMTCAPIQLSRPPPATHLHPRLTRLKSDGREKLLFVRAASVFFCLFRVTAVTHA